MKKILLVLLFVPFFVACEDKPPILSEPISVRATNDKATKIIGATEDGYVLMKQQCFSCHLENMGGGSSGSKIAPPMMRVQEHYKPLYPKKDDFVKAVAEWVKNPNQERANMPGAVRKFKLMPALNIEDAKLELIAGALFDADFVGGGKKGKSKRTGLELDEGKKWKLKPASIQTLKKMGGLLRNFKSEEIKDYQALGKTLFRNTRPLVLDENYKGKLFEQLHAFFGSIEGSMHALMTVENAEDAQKHLRNLRESFSKFPAYFE